MAMGRGAYFGHFIDGGFFIEFGSEFGVERQSDHVCITFREVIVKEDTFESQLGTKSMWENITKIKSWRCFNLFSLCAAPNLPKKAVSYITVHFLVSFGQI